MKKNPKLVLITQYFPPEMGAPQSRLYELTMGMRSLGWDVIVFTAFPNYPSGKILKGYRHKFYMHEILEGIDVHRYWLFPSNSKSSLPRILSMLSFSCSILFASYKIRKLSPDYTLVESPPLTLGLSGWLIAKFSRSRMILNVSDLWPLSASALGAISSDSKLYRLLEKLETFLYKNSYLCTGQSEEITEYISRKGASRVWLFRNGVDPSRFPPRTQILHNKPLKMVYAGLLGIAQGILSYCKALDFPKLNIEFHIVGDGAELISIREYIDQNKNCGIVLHPSIAREDIPSFLSSFDLSFIPLQTAIYGAVPSKIYESMAAGLPILFAGGGEGEKIINTYKLGWTCTPSDFTALHNLLGHISAQPDSILQEISSNCRKAAYTTFNRKEEIEKFNLYLKVM